MNLVQQIHYLVMNPILQTKGMYRIVHSSNGWEKILLMSHSNKTNPESVLGVDSSARTKCENYIGYQNGYWEETTLYLHVFFFAFSWTHFFFLQERISPKYDFGCSPNVCWISWEPRCQGHLALLAGELWVLRVCLLPYCLGSWWHNNTVTPLLMAHTLAPAELCCPNNSTKLHNWKVISLLGDIYNTVGLKVHPGEKGEQSVQVSTLKNLWRFKLENHFSERW